MQFCYSVYITLLVRCLPLQNKPAPLPEPISGSAVVTVIMKKSRYFHSYKEDDGP